MEMTCGCCIRAMAVVTPGVDLISRVLMLTGRITFSQERPLANSSSTGSTILWKLCTSNIDGETLTHK